jgi:hypothetical protein
MEKNVFMDKKFKTEKDRLMSFKCVLKTPIAEKLTTWFVSERQL